MKQFTKTDIQPHTVIADAGKIICDRADLINNPPEWMKRGLQETASGYGARLNSGLSINFCGKIRRIYCTCYSNVSSGWFIANGQKIFVY